jgi:hypothetical protein
MSAQIIISRFCSLSPRYLQHSPKPLQQPNPSLSTHPNTSNTPKHDHTVNNIRNRHISHPPKSGARPPRRQNQHYRILPQFRIFRSPTVLPSSRRFTTQILYYCFLAHYFFFEQCLFHNRKVNSKILDNEQHPHLNPSPHRCQWCSVEEYSKIIYHYYIFCHLHYRVCSFGNICE